MKQSEKEILFIDMDGVVADFNSYVEKLCPGIFKRQAEGVEGEIDEVCGKHPRCFYELELIPGAVNSVKTLSNYYDVYFLSTPMWSLPESFTDKRLWIDKYFGVEFEKRLILTHRKDLTLGHYLIDDRKVHGVENFKGYHIHFGTPGFPNWEVITSWLIQIKEYNKDRKNLVTEFLKQGSDTVTSM